MPGLWGISASPVPTSPTWLLCMHISVSISRPSSHSRLRSYDDDDIDDIDDDDGGGGDGGDDGDDGGGDDDDDDIDDDGFQAISY